MQSIMEMTPFPCSSAGGQVVGLKVTKSGIVVVLLKTGSRINWEKGASRNSGAQRSGVIPYFASPPLQTAVGPRDSKTSNALVHQLNSNSIFCCFNCLRIGNAFIGQNTIG